ncbi:MAG TPA: methylated-DNA--[protein]-cysteine S-methyltransferase [Burkholderiaceae bacterium]|jgi:methylated-DNA-[protein]-cysteine S-methyltransferase
MTSPPRFTLFDTAVGGCAIAWAEQGLVGVLLPEANDAATRARARRRCPGAVEAAAPAEVQRVIERIRDLLNGGRDALADIALDLSAVPPFHRRVYAVARTIQPGQTRSYGEIASALGEAPQAAREVGQALGANPFPIIVPCHRVLAAGAKAGGFSAPGGTRTKLRLLEIECAPLGGTPGLFD